MAYVITLGCVDIMDRNCMEQCPVDAIHAGERMAYISPDECIDCGACVPVCPQTAIFVESSVPEDQQSFTTINAEFFDQDIDFDGDVGPHPDHPTITRIART